MSYTVSRLAKMSGVSVRTLHWYDEIGLLKPLYHGANGRRYYEEAELLKLQQILFFRELGFNLEDIQKLLKRSDFDTIKALTAHRRRLEDEIDRTHVLIDTIDKTLLHLRGKTKMKNKEELYLGFDSEQKKDYKAYLAKFKGTVIEELMEKVVKSKKFTEADHERLETAGASIYKALTKLMEAGCTPRDEKVQAEIKKHYALIEYYYTPSKGLYDGLAQLYCEHEDFLEYFARFHKDLAPFLSEAMQIFAQKHLKA